MTEDKRTMKPQYEITDEYTGWLMQIKEKKSEEKT